MMRRTGAPRIQPGSTTVRARSIAGKQTLSESMQALAALGDRWKRRVPGRDALGISTVARLGAVARLVERFHRRVLKPLGLELSDYQVLAALWIAEEAETHSPKSLASLLGQTPAGMTKTLDRLEGRDAIDRVRDQEDRRAVRIQLTRAGRELAEQACHAELTSQEELFTDFRKGDLERLNDYLDRLIRSTM